MLDAMTLLTALLIALLTALLRGKWTKELKKHLELDSGNPVQQKECLILQTVRLSKKFSSC